MIKREKNIIDNIYNFYNYNFMEQRIGAPPNISLYDYYLNISRLLKVNQILELGYGTGFLTKLLLENNFIITAIDKSQEAKEHLFIKCKNLPTINNLTALASDILDFKTHKKFKLILASDDFIKHFYSKTDLSKFFKKINSLLDEDGVFISDSRIFLTGQLDKIFLYPIFTLDKELNGIKYINCISWNIQTEKNVMLVHFKYEEMNSKGKIIRSFIKILKQGVYNSAEIEFLSKKRNLELELHEEPNLNCNIYFFRKQIKRK
ncbi:MAG: class I SAM-dependent methyltransferase [Lentimicrobium sp.]